MATKEEIKAIIEDCDKAHQKNLKTIQAVTIVLKIMQPNTYQRRDKCLKRP